MDDLSSILQQAPPGTDVFDFLSATIDQLAFPSLGRPFWIQQYIAAGLCGVVVLVISSALYIRARRKCLKLFISDGPATRPNPRAVVPILWLITGIIFIIHTFWLRASFQDRRFSYSLGCYWFMMATALVCSYAVVSTSMMCMAPGVRKGLARLNEWAGAGRTAPSFIAVNGSLLGICILAVCSTYIPGHQNGQGFVALTKGYKGLQDLLVRARSQQDITLLASATEYMDLLAKAEEHDRRGIYLGGIVYSTYIVFFFLTSCLPALFLNIYLRKRINSLEKGLYLSTLAQTVSLYRPDVDTVQLPFEHPDPDQDVEVIAAGFHRSRPTLNISVPKESPFSNLTPTSMLPTNYASIFQAQVEPQEKARRLKLALQRDNYQLVAYFLMLASMGSLAFFQAAKGPYALDTKRKFIVATAWEVWSFLAPAMVLAGATLYDAISNTSSEDEVAEVQRSSFGNRSFAAPPMASIQLSQTIEVVEEHGLQEKKSISAFEIERHHH